MAAVSVWVFFFFLHDLVHTNTIVHSVRGLCLSTTGLTGRKMASCQSCDTALYNITGVTARGQEGRRGRKKAGQVTWTKPELEPT